ncbi:MAG: hypothetical protein M0P52_00235 [Rhodoferax sp.]|jgi:hypothetical protein|nr:hypothetical protein [Rhodoferax sp.]
MNPTSTQAAESGVAMIAKSAPPVSVSIATIVGMPVSDLVLWGTLLYTMLMIGHKMLAIYRDIKQGGRDERNHQDVA